LQAIKFRIKSGDQPRWRQFQFWKRVIEVAVWGTVFWGLIRMVAHYLGFTPYGVRAFSRPIIGIDQEDTLNGVIIGSIVLFILVLAGTALYAFLFSRLKLWWGGLIYGAAWMLLFGFFFPMFKWKAGTLSTEIAWFLTLGLFIGMTFVAERTDRE